jgi:rSAM/selenodomain-associated transferase 2
LKALRENRDVELSVIVPALNEEGAIAETLAALQAAGDVRELLVADGGSQDRTAEVARQAGAVVITAAPGRGQQMHAAARMARGDILWFVHADTLPPPDAGARIRAALADPTVAGGSFAVRFSGSSRAARFFTAAYPLMRRLGLCYGDATLFVRRAVYEASGGFRPYPVFEDLDLVRRLRHHGRLVCVPEPVVTSSRRFEGRSALRIVLLWSLMHGLYWLGVSPERLARLYYPARGESQRG